MRQQLATFTLYTLDDKNICLVLFSLLAAISKLSIAEMQLYIKKNLVY